MLVALIATCVVLLVLDSGGQRLRGARTAAADVFLPVERAFAAVVNPVGDFFSGLPDVGSNKRALDSLARQNARLQARLRAGQLDATRLAELQKLGLTAATDHLAVVPATVLDFGPSLGFEWTVRIDVGTADRVHGGQTVVDADGLVGRITQAGSHSAVVLLAADPGSNVGVRVARTGELGLASGHGAGSMGYRPIGPTSAVRTGDVLVSGPSGSSTYTAGIPIGTVTSMHRSAAGFSVTVKPYVNYTRLDVLGVVTRQASAATRPTITGPAPR